MREKEKKKEVRAWGKGAPEEFSAFERGKKNPEI
jgi:hypothetical protein